MSDRWKRHGRTMRIYRTPLASFQVEGEDGEYVLHCNGQNAVDLESDNIYDACLEADQRIVDQCFEIIQQIRQEK